MIPTSDAISPSVQSVHALAKTFMIKKMKKKEKKKKRAAFREEKINVVVRVYRCSREEKRRHTFIADCMYAVCTCGGRLVALGCKRASTTST